MTVEQYIDEGRGHKNYQKDYANLLLDFFELPTSMLPADPGVMVLPNDLKRVWSDIQCLLLGRMDIFSELMQEICLVPNNDEADGNEAARAILLRNIFDGVRPQRPNDYVKQVLVENPFVNIAILQGLGYRRALGMVKWKMDEDKKENENAV